MQQLVKNFLKPQELLVSPMSGDARDSNSSRPVEACGFSAADGGHC